jgi:hypothetical protein
MGAPASGATQTVTRFTPTNAVVAQGTGKGELIVSWSMPIRPDVVATVIYEGPDAAKARAIVNYDTSPKASPRATVRGLPSGHRVCLSVANLVSRDDRITNVSSGPVCAVPR